MKHKLLTTMAGMQNENDDLSGSDESHLSASTLRRNRAGYQFWYLGLMATSETQAAYDDG